MQFRALQRDFCDQFLQERVNIHDAKLTTDRSYPKNERLSMQRKLTIEYSGILTKGGLGIRSYMFIYSASYGRAR